MTAEPEQSAPAAELAELRRCLDVGLARIDGKLALLSQRVDHTQQELAELTLRVTLLERTRWPLPAVAALCGIGAVVVAFWEVLTR